MKELALSLSLSRSRLWKLCFVQATVYAKGDNQNQADILAGALVAVDPAKIHDLPSETNLQRVPLLWFIRLRRRVNSC